MHIKKNYGDSTLNVFFLFFFFEKKKFISKVSDTVFLSVPRFIFVFLVMPSRGKLRKQKTTNKTNQNTTLCIAIRVVTEAILFQTN